MKLETAVDKMIKNEVHIHIASQEQWDEIMEYLDTKGIKWKYDRKATEGCYFDNYSNIGILYDTGSHSLLYFNNSYNRDDGIAVVDIDGVDEEPAEDILTELLTKLGIKANEPFYVEHNYKFTLYNPYVWDGKDTITDCETDPIDEAVLLGIILKKLKVRAGFPQNGDTYYYVDVSGSVSCKEWAARAVDYAMLYMGNVFSSHSAAFEKVNKFRAIYSELKNK